MNTRINIIVQQIQQDYQSKMISNSRNQSYDFNPLAHSQLSEPTDYRLYQSNSVDRAFKADHQSNRYYGASNDNLGFQSIGGSLAAQKGNSYYNNSNNKSDESLGGTWVWRVGDRCMAKYWEDNMVGLEESLRIFLIRLFIVNCLSV